MTPFTVYCGVSPTKYMIYEHENKTRITLTMTVHWLFVDVVLNQHQTDLN